MSSLVSIEEKLMRVEESKNRVIKDFNSFRKNYPDEFVAVIDGEVKYHDGEHDRLLEMIRKDNMTTEGFFVLFIPSKRTTLVV